jgi:hypothetical protein
VATTERAPPVEFIAMSEFRLEPWELPPNKDSRKRTLVLEIGHVTWNGEETAISVRTMPLLSREVLILFRPHNTEANFMVSSGHTICPFEMQIGEGKLERIVHRAIKGNEFSFRRAFYLKEQLCLMSTTDSVWVTPPNQSDSVFTLPFDAMTEPSSRIFSWLEQEWDKPDSEVRFSWQWSHKNSQERHEYLEELVPGWRELFELMRAAARVAELPECARWILDHVDTYNQPLKLLARLQPWKELLRLHFIPFEPFPESAPECLQDYFAFISNHVSVVGESTSNHERLEARHHLRNWLQRNAPERVDLLLAMDAL